MWMDRSGLVRLLARNVGLAFLYLVLALGLPAGVAMAVVARTGMPWSWFAVGAGWGVAFVWWAARVSEAAHRRLA